MKYIYVLIDPISNEIRYVGQTRAKLDNRLTHHLKDKTKTHKTCWLKSLTKIDKVPIIQSLKSFETISDEELNKEEIYWISFCKDLGLDLTNSTDGGRGTSGHKMSTESRNRISLSVKSRPFKHRRKVVRSEEWCRKISEARKGCKISDEQRKQISQTLTGKKLSEETCRKISEANYRRWRNVNSLLE
jgi:hypothetical protein